MFNIKLNGLLALICFMALSSANASFWPPAPDNNTNKNAAPANKVLSPDEFKSRVNSVSQQNQAGLNNQVQQILSKQPAAPSLPPPPIPQKKQPKAQTPAANETNEPNETPPTIPEPPQDTTETALPAAAPPANSPPPAAAAPAPQQNQSYSGFIGTGNNNASPTNKGGATKSNGGWSVKY